MITLGTEVSGREDAVSTLPVVQPDLQVRQSVIQLDTYLLDANLLGTSQTPPLGCHHDTIGLATPLAASPSLSKQVFIYGHMCALVHDGRSGDNLQEPVCSLHLGSPGIEFRSPGRVGQPTLLPYRLPMSLASLLPCA